MGNSKTCRGLQVSKVKDMQPPALRHPYLPAEKGQDDGAFDDRLAALKAAKKQAPYGSSRKDGKDKDGAPKQGEKRCTCTSQILVAAPPHSSLYLRQDRLCSSASAAFTAGLYDMRC